MAFLPKIIKFIAVNANALNAQVNNVYDQGVHLGTLCSNSAYSKPMFESVVGVHWSRLVEL